MAERNLVRVLPTLHKEWIISFSLFADKNQPHKSNLFHITTSINGHVDEEGTIFDINLISGPNLGKYLEFKFNQKTYGSLDNSSISPSDQSTSVEISQMPRDESYCFKVVLNENQTFEIPVDDAKNHTLVYVFAAANFSDCKGLCSIKHAAGGLVENLVINSVGK